MISNLLMSAIIASTNLLGMLVLILVFFMLNGTSVYDFVKHFEFKNLIRNAYPWMK